MVGESRGKGHPILLKDLKMWLENSRDNYLERTPVYSATAHEEPVGGPESWSAVRILQVVRRDLVSLVIAVA